MFVRNQTKHSVSFAPSKLLVLKRSTGAWVDEHWPTPQAFREDINVLAHWSRNHIAVEYRPVETK